MSTVIFFLLGQLVFVIAVSIYEDLTPRYICDEIETRKNVAEGIDLAGLLVALALILRASIAGPFNGWISGVFSFVLYSIVGIVILLVCRSVANKMFLPRTSYDQEIRDDQNEGAAMISSVIQVALAVIIAACL